MQTNRDNPGINALCERFFTIASLRKRFNYLLTSELYQASIALDPHIKLSFTDSNNTNEGKHLLFSSSVVKQSILSLLPQRPSTTATPSLSTTSEPVTKTKTIGFL